MDRLTAARVFVEVVERGSQTAAAEHLEMSRAMISRYLGELESWVGARLLHRTTRRLSLTGMGAELLPRCRDMLALADELQSAGQRVSSQLGGTLRIASSQSFAQAWLARAVAAFVERHPAVAVDLQVSSQAVNLVEERIDLALRITNQLDPNLIARRLATCHSVLCAAPAYLARHGTPTTPQDLLQHNCIAFHIAGRPARTWRFGRDGQWTEVRVKGNRTADDAALARDWAIAGHGIIYKSVPYLHHELQHSPLVRLLPEWDTPPYPLQALLPSGRFVPARVRALVDFLVAKFDGLPQE